VVASVFLASCTANWKPVEPSLNPNSAIARYNWWIPFANLYSVWGAADGKELWAVGEGGTILHSVDGATWKPQASHTTAKLFSVRSTGEGRAVWAVGERGTILQNTGGAVWKLQASGTMADLLSVFVAADNKTTWVVGAKGTILRCVDGATWKPQMSGTEASLLAMYGTLDGTRLWVVGTGGTILTSTDGWTWQAQASNTTERIESAHGTGDGKTLWAAGSRGTILRSTDGMTWQHSQEVFTDLHSVFGTVDGRSLWATGDAGAILHSTDGVKWERQSSSFYYAIKSVYGTPDGKKLWAVGEHGAILYSADGSTWRRQDPHMSSMNSIYATGDGKTLWAVGERGMILQNTDGETWKPQASGTKADLLSVYGARNGTELWVAGAGGTILHSGDGRAWQPQVSNTTARIESIYGTGDGKTLWAVAGGGTILHSADGATWRPQISGTTADLNSVYGTGDGKTLWAVGRDATILHSTDGASWESQPNRARTNLGERGYLNSVYVAGHGKAVWAVGEDGAMMLNADGSGWQEQEEVRGQPYDLTAIRGIGNDKTLWAVGSRGTVLRDRNGLGWRLVPVGVDAFFRSVWGTDDGKTLWLAASWGPGEGGFAKGTYAGYYPFLVAARISQTLPESPRLELQLRCDSTYDGPVKLLVYGRNESKFKRERRGDLVPYRGSWHPQTCTFDAVPFIPDDLEVRSGDELYFDLTVETGEDYESYEFHAPYDPWRWFNDHRKPLGAVAAIVIVFTALFTLLFVQPLWNLRLYLALKQPLIDKLFAIPLAGPVLELIFNLCTFGLPWFVAHSRTLDAWVAEHRSAIERRWGEETLPARAAASDQQRTIEATPYVPLPLSIGDPSAGTLISQPTSDDISKLFSEKRTVIQVIGAGGAGKTTLARQCGLWALMGGRPGGIRGHAMLPVWIDDDMAADQKPLKPLIAVVQDKLATLLPEAKMDDLLLRALLKKQRMLPIIDRLSERSAATQEYVGKIYSSTRAEALLITTRRAIAVEGVTPIRVFPQPLNERTLLYFMQVLLQSGGANDKPEPTNVSLDKQVKLDEKLSALYRNSVRADGNLLPLPVRLFVEEAKGIIAASGSLDSLPQSIPDVYSRYLERVNPDNPSVPNFMSHAEMLRAAKILAKLALGDDLIPKEFYAEEAAAELKRQGWADSQKVDPIQRLVDNGVLISKGELLRRLKFVLDPIAAAAHLQEARHDPARLRSLRDNAKQAMGFLAWISTDKNSPKIEDFAVRYR
jgi:photosystem II stability/assembly factor-like uncharacterized protein